MGKLNWAALGVVAAGGVILVIAWEGTHRQVWSAITGQPLTNAPPPGAPYDLQGASASVNVSNYPSSSSANAGVYQQAAMADATAAGINPTYFVRQIQAESGFNPGAVSPAGAEGIAQFMPATAKSMGVDPFDPLASLKAAAQLMYAYIQRFGSEDKALSAYNAGPGATQSAINKGGVNWELYVPTQTQNYIATITGTQPPKTGTA
jgi:soluble lytic murein transglycosylase-like protein